MHRLFLSCLCPLFQVALSQLVPTTMANNYLKYDWHKVGIWKRRPFFFLIFCTKAIFHEGVACAVKNNWQVNCSFTVDTNVTVVIPEAAPRFANVTLDS